MKAGGILIVMGVSGSGKSTIGQQLAHSLRVPFFDADDYHSTANRDKMARGEPLTDSDRWPWLDEFAQAIGESRETESLVVAGCSALRQAYRSRIGKALSNVRWVFLDIPEAVLQKRLAERKHPFLPPSLLKSQIRTLEPPQDALWISGDLPVAETVRRILLHLAENPIRA